MDKELEELFNRVDPLLSRLVERQHDNQQLAAEAQATLDKLREYREKKERESPN